MRISDRLIPAALPAALFSVGLGLVSAFGFEGTGPRDSVVPAMGVDTIPRAAETAQAPVVPPMPIPNASGSGGSMNIPPAKPVTRSLTAPVHALTPGEAFLTGTEALRAGDAKAGIRALEYAAENGHTIAEWKLGRMFADGDQVTRNDLRAFKYFQDIVDNHSDDAVGTPQARFVSNAYVALGGYFANGIPDSDVMPDLLRARDLYAYAASYFGDAEAQYRLGRMVLEGQGGSRDPWQAVRWLKLAADKGHFQAQALLGVTLFRGEAIPRQAPRGLMYLTIARDMAPQDKTIADLQARAFAQASDDERAMALSYLEGWLKGRRD
jgi:hypothetical protein